MRPRLTKIVLATFLFFVTTLWPSAASADVIAIGPAAFPGNSTLITFTGVANLTELNGLAIDGVVFSIPRTGVAFIGASGGTTNNLSPPSIVNPFNVGPLTITLAGLSDRFGYGYLLNTSMPVANATTITLFNGLTNVGTLSYNGVPDPTLTGGFAGIQSTIPFDRVVVTFSGLGYGMDNIRISAPEAVPEPTTVLLLAPGLAGIAMVLRRLKATKSKR